VDTGNQGAVVSELFRLDKRFLVIVNRSLDKPMTLKVEVKDALKVKRIHKDGTIRPLAAAKTVYNVGAGDVVIFMWKQ
jgi:hypothetical protein